MNYGRAIVICKSLDSEEFSESEILEAVGTILDMPTINAVPKDALLNVVRFFWEHCVEQLQAGEDEDVISRAAAIKTLSENSEHLSVWEQEVQINLIANLPAADVRPVVRCKDCAHGCLQLNGVGVKVVQCLNSGHPCHNWLLDPDWFCKDGQRRKEDND